MKRIVVLLIIILSTKIISFSQNILTETRQDSTVLITAEQLKYTNLIFAEHNKLFNENKLLKAQLNNFKVKTDLFEKTDSLRLQQINNYNNLNNAYKLQIDKLNSDLNKKDKTIVYLKIGGITISLGLLILLFLK